MRLIDKGEVKGIAIDQVFVSAAVSVAEAQTGDQRGISGISFSVSQFSTLNNLCSSSPAMALPSPPLPPLMSSCPSPYLSVRLHLQDAVISLARLDVYCEAEIENGL